MNDAAYENVRRAVREVMKEEGMLELVQLKGALFECSEKLTLALTQISECQQQTEVWRSLARAYKRELALIRDKVKICEDCVKNKDNGDNGRS